MLVYIELKVFLALTFLLHHPHQRGHFKVKVTEIEFICFMKVSLFCFTGNNYDDSCKSKVWLSPSLLGEPTFEVILLGLSKR